MATMKALVVHAPGQPFKPVDDFPVPEVEPTQILVKSIATGINPVDQMMRTTGLLVTQYPIVLGCDAGGNVEAVGSEVTNFKAGDEVCGCTRLGWPGSGTFAEYYVMDASLTIPKPSKLSIEQAAAIGVGSETAALGIFPGLQIPLPDLKNLPAEKDEWVIVFGGSGSVGQYAVQMAKLCGYKVIATSSPHNFEVLKSLGASATVSNRDAASKQAEDIMSATGGRCARAFDAATNSHDIAADVLKKSTIPGKKYFTTTDDWTPTLPEAFASDIVVDRIDLGIIGRPTTPKEWTSTMESLIPVIYGLFEMEDGLKAQEVLVVEGGIEKALEARADPKVGSAKKVVAKVEF